MYVLPVMMYSDTVDHLVNSASLGHTFYFDEVSDTTVFPHLLVCSLDSVYLPVLYTKH